MPCHWLGTSDILMAVKRQISDRNQSDYFNILNIECGNLLERTWGGSNEYPHSVFKGKYIKKTMYQCDPYILFIAGWPNDSECS